MRAPANSPLSSMLSRQGLLFDLTVFTRSLGRGLSLALDLAEHLAGDGAAGCPHHLWLAICADWRGTKSAGWHLRGDPLRVTMVC
jgi:hypothetical protein